MALIDFKEIPKANGGCGSQDAFELFARDFFETLEFQIEEDPDRGADGGRDLIIIEKRTGTLGDTIFETNLYMHGKRSKGYCSLGMRWRRCNID
jgi:hypothetical protein